MRKSHPDCRAAARLRLRCPLTVALARDGRCPPCSSDVLRQRRRCRRDPRRLPSGRRIVRRGRAAPALPRLHRQHAGAGMGQDDRRLEAPARHVAPGTSVPASRVRQGSSPALVAMISSASAEECQNRVLDRSQAVGCHRSNGWPEDAQVLFSFSRVNPTSFLYCDPRDGAGSRLTVRARFTAPAARHRRGAHPARPEPCPVVGQWPGAYPIACDRD